MRRSVDRFCRDCGYEFPRDDTDGECRMCPRFEQLRIDPAVPRPSELASRQARSGETIDSGPVPSEDWPPTPAEYRAVLAARRASTPSANRQGRGPAATVIGTPALPRPANSAIEGHTAASAGGPPPPPKKKSAARRKNRTPTPTPPPVWPGPILIRLRAPQQPAIVTMEAPTAALAGQSPVPAETSTARRARPVASPSPSVGPTPIVARYRRQPMQLRGDPLPRWQVSRKLHQRSPHLGTKAAPRPCRREKASRIGPRRQRTKTQSLQPPRGHRVSGGRTARHLAASSRRWAASQTAFGWLP
jgi:hypothetical protein